MNQHDISEHIVERHYGVRKTRFTLTITEDGCMGYRIRHQEWLLRDRDSQWVEMCDKANRDIGFIKRYYPHEHAAIVKAWRREVVKTNGK